MTRTFASVFSLSLALGCSSRGTVPTFTVGGSVTGLAGTGLVLSCGPGQQLAISTDGPFSCPGQWPPGVTFEVQVATQPANPAQTCAVENGAGAVQDADVSTVTVTCTTNRHRVGGVVHGLEGGGLTLQLNGGEELPIPADGPFWFGGTVPSGGAWFASVVRQPTAPWQTCSLAGAEGTIADADAPSVIVDCRTDAYAIGGRVAGLAGTGLVLQNGLETLAVVSDGAFVFGNPVLSGAQYYVTVARQPASPTQACTVSGGLGTVAGEDVTGVAVRCATRYGVAGTVEGLLGTGLVLALAVPRIEALSISTNGPFRFAAQLETGTAFTVTVATPPASPSQRCEVVGGTGVIADADASVRVVCAIALPAVDSFSPSRGPPGTIVAIAGSGLAGASSVRFGAAPASFTVVSDASITAVVPAGALTAPISVATPYGTATSIAAFTVTPTDLDLFIESAYVTQAIAGRSSPVALVAGRPGLLRVFPLASAPGAATPRVRVQLVTDGVTKWTRTIEAPGPSAPTVVDESELSGSWNLALGPDDLVAGTNSTLQLMVDPDDVVAERDEMNNRTTVEIASEAVPPLDVTLVPIVLSSGTGNVDEANRTSWVDRLVRMYPIDAIDVRLRAPLTPSVSAVRSDGTGWDVILQELATARAIEAPNRYYFGALHVPYTSGVAGLGMVGEPVALGWDRSDARDGGNFPEVLAHELGHNFGRYHAPCGNPASVDPNWPRDAAHQQARIGTWGWDVRPQTTSPAVLKDPATTFDIMGYCSDVWASDYTYTGILQFRRTSQVGFVAATTRRGLLVTGVERDGRWTVEPAFVVDAAPTSEAGPLTLELRDAGGIIRASSSFHDVEVLDGAGSLRRFAVVVPLDGIDVEQIASVVVTRGGAELARIDRAGVTPATPPKARRDAPGWAGVEWDASAHPLVMVRDARTGEVLAFGRGGRVRVPTTAPDLELHLSDGVSSTRHVVGVE